MACARIAIAGISIEANAFAPWSDFRTFANYAYLRGEEILSAGVIDYWLGAHGSRGFLPAMGRLRDWRPIPILIADGQAGGPVKHEDYECIKSELLQRLEDQLPVDAIYIVGHGAGTTTLLHDLDGDYFTAIRDCVGDGVPIVATLDLHANLTPEMIAACDAIVSQRTNPHVDSELRAEDAARLIDLMLGGWRPAQAASQLPLLTPQISQLTYTGEPLGNIIQCAEQYIADGECLGVSIMPGFSLSDTPHSGFWLYAFGDDESMLKSSLKSLSEKAWSMRDRFSRSTISVNEAIVIAQCLEDGAGPAIFADIADNPGGGGTGNTTWLLEAFISAGIAGGVFAPFVDANLVSAAFKVGVGSEFEAHFNKVDPTDFARPYVCDAKVIWIGDGDYDSKYGVYAGSRVPLGPSCVLEVNGNKVIVITASQQLLGEDFITHFGVDVAAARFIVAKSRGHFRAGLSHLVPPSKIFEVDSLGLTTARLTDVPWRNLSRPISPLDDDMLFQCKIQIFPRR